MAPLENLRRRCAAASSEALEISHRRLILDPAVSIYVWPEDLPIWDSGEALTSGYLLDILKLGFDASSPKEQTPQSDHAMSAQQMQVPSYFKPEFAYRYGYLLNAALMHMQ